MRKWSVYVWNNNSFKERLFICFSKYITFLQKTVIVVNPASTVSCSPYFTSDSKKYKKLWKLVPPPTGKLLHSRIPRVCFAYLPEFLTMKLFRNSFFFKQINNIVRARKTENYEIVTIFWNMNTIVPLVRFLRLHTVVLKPQSFGVSRVWL